MQIGHNEATRACAHTREGASAAGHSENIPNDHRRESTDRTVPGAASIQNRDIARLNEEGWDTASELPTPHGVGWLHPQLGYVWSDATRHTKAGPGGFQWYGRTHGVGVTVGPFPTIWGAVVALGGGPDAAA